MECRHESIEEFVSHGHSSPNVNNIKRMTSFEKNRLDIAMMLYSLNLIGGTSPLEFSMKGMLQSEMDRVCVGSQFLQHMTNGIITPKNIKMQKFGFNCSCSTEKHVYLVTTTKRFPVIHGLCQTFDCVLGCKKIEFNLPADISCFAFYENPKCQGSVMTFVDNAKKFQKGLETMR